MDSNILWVIMLMILAEIFVLMVKEIGPMKSMEEIGLPG